ncbi:chaplin [Streptomyces sp. NPDC015171]|uniref:chaplin n=1 Tax=Streptomyces sp. NPDC015171 TaxID=3364945 RepID=UPI0036F9BD51
MIAVAAVSGAMAMAGTAYADSAADGSVSNSPGVLSGNGIQLPVHIPLNVCGNTVDVVGLLNPAMGNSCANVGGHAGGKGASSTAGGATAKEEVHDSPGLISGNGIQLPVDLPLNISGNTANLVGIGNPVFGNQSVNTSTDVPETPPVKVTPPVHSEPPAKPHQPAKAHAVPKPDPVVVPPREPVGTLANTGADATWTVAAASLASLMGGAVLYRRFRPGGTGR